MRTKLARRLKDRRGFTLIELMMVVAVIIILAAVLIPRIGAARKEAKYTGVLQNLNTVHGVVETMIDKNKYQGDDTGDEKLAYDLKQKLTNLDSDLKNPYSGSTDVQGPSDSGDTFNEDDISNKPAVAVVTGEPGSDSLLKDAAGSVVAYVSRSGSQTVVVLHPFDSEGNRMDGDKRTINP
jgi:type IV pilus assembly protein PilA